MFSDFSSAGGKIWNRPGPGRYQTVDDLIEPIIKNVDYTFDEAMTKQHNDGNNYYSITRDRLAKAVDDNMSDILATQSGGFHYWKAMEAAKALGGDEEMGKKIFKDMISNRLSDHEKIKFEADPFRLDTHRTMNDNWLDKQRQARQHYYHGLENKETYTPNIFREAEALTQGQKKNIGQLVQYELPQQYYQKIDPAVQAGQRNMQDKNGNKLTAYVYSGEQLRTTGTMWVYNENDGQMHKAKMKVSKSGNYTFIPDGSMRAKYLGERNGYPQYRYWISGQFRTPDGHRVINNTEGVSGETQWVEVKERAFNYGQTQKKE